MIPAGGSGRLTARVATKSGQSGRVSKSVTVVTDVTNSAPLQLRFGFEATSPVLVMPRANLYLSGQVGHPRAEKLLLRRSDGEPLEILEAKPDVAGTLDVSWQPAHPEDEANERGMVPKVGDVWLEVSTTKNAAPGRLSGTITVRTNHPQAATLEVPYTLILQAPIEPRPAEVRLWLSQGNAAGRQSVFRLSSTTGTPFTIKSMTLSSPELFEAVEATEGEQLHHNISISLRDGAAIDSGNLPTRASLTIATNDAEMPEVLVPLVLSNERLVGRRMPPVPHAAVPRPTGTPAAGG